MSLSIIDALIHRAVDISGRHRHFCFALGAGTDGPALPAKAVACSADAAPVMAEFVGNGA